MMTPFCIAVTYADFLQKQNHQSLPPCYKAVRNLILPQVQEAVYTWYLLDGRHTRRQLANHSWNVHLPQSIL